MKTRCVVLAVMLFVFCFPVTAQKKITSAPESFAIKKAHAAQTSSPLEPQVDGYLKQTGYQYGKVKTNSWYISLTGKNMPHIRIIMGAGGQSLAIGAVVLSKRNLQVSSESMYKMMKLSYDLNYIRTCIDTDDDLLVMSQLKGKWLDYQEFKETVDKVAAAADRDYGEMRPYMIQ
jgi:hypothetical protein